MWFKQIQFFDVEGAVQTDPEVLTSQLAPYEFTACLPTMPMSQGWVAPVETDSGEEESPLAYVANGYVMLCLQVEEKILPSTVVREAVDEKIRRIEAQEGRKVYRKQRMEMKEEMTHTLMAKAFTKNSKVYAYIDTKTNRLIINSTNKKKVDIFITLLQRSTQLKLTFPEIKKPGPVMTDWVKNDTAPNGFMIEKSGVLYDPNQQSRVIRCAQQSLFSKSIQSLLEEGCEIKQVAMSWREQLQAVFVDDLTIRSIKYDDEVLSVAKDNYTESAKQTFHADFVLMSDIISKLFADLMPAFKSAGVLTEA